VSLNTVLGTEFIKYLQVEGKKQGEKEAETEMNSMLSSRATMFDMVESLSL
jgi:hypothetical protein